jgi:hypothetical protein
MSRQIGESRHDVSWRHLSPEDRASCEARALDLFGARRQASARALVDEMLAIAIDEQVGGIFAERVVQTTGVDPVEAHDRDRAAANEYARARRDELRALVARQRDFCRQTVETSVAWCVRGKVPFKLMTTRVADQLALALSLAGLGHLHSEGTPLVAFDLLKRAATVIARLTLRSQTVSSFDELVEQVVEILVSAGSPLLDAGQLLDAESLVTRLQARAAGDRAAQTVHRSLSSETRRMMAAHDPTKMVGEALRRALVRGLNRLISGPPLAFAKPRRAGSRRAAARGLRASADQPRRNRVALERALRGALAPSPKSWFEFRSLGQAIEYFKRRVKWHLAETITRPVPEQLIRSDLIRDWRGEFPETAEADAKPAPLVLARFDRFCQVLETDRAVRYWVLDQLYTADGRNWKDIAFHLNGDLRQVLKASHVPPGRSMEEVQSSFDRMAARARAGRHTPQALRQFHSRSRRQLARAAR